MPRPIPSSLPTASTPDGWTTPEGYQNYELGLGRRYIFDGSRVVTERTFEPGSTLAEVICELERIHVGSILFTAIDADTDGAAAETCLDMTGNSSYAGGLASPPSDVSFYYYTNRSGRVAAYACKHSDEVIYEYLVHRVFGEVVYLPVVQIGGGDIRETTPTSLTDNEAASGSRERSLVGGTNISGANVRDSNTGVSNASFRMDHPTTDEEATNWCETEEAKKLKETNSCLYDCYCTKSKRGSRRSKFPVQICKDLCSSSGGVNGAPSVNRSNSRKSAGVGETREAESKDSKHDVYIYYDWALLAKEGCAAGCVVEHEEVHAKDFGPCMQKYRLCLQAAAGNKKATDDCKTKWEAYKSDVSWSECNAIKVQCDCLKKLVDKIAAGVEEGKRKCFDAIKKQCDDWKHTQVVAVNNVPEYTQDLLNCCKLGKNSDVVVLGTKYNAEDCCRSVASQIYKTISYYKDEGVLSNAKKQSCDKKPTEVACPF